MLKKVMLVAALAVGSFMNAQTGSLGVLYGASVKNADASYGAFVEFSGIGIQYMSGAFLSDLDYSDVDAYINGETDSYTTGGSYDRVGFFTNSISIPNTPVSALVGGGIQFNNMITTEGIKKTNNPYVNVGLTIDLPNSVYALGSIVLNMDQSSTSAVFGVGYRF